MEFPSSVVFVVDSREQRPYALDPSIVRALPAGDYSLVGFEDRVAIERKSHADAYSSLGHSRDRFEREVARLSKYEYAAIIVESSLPEFLKPPAFSRLNPRAAIATLLSWSVKHGVQVFFAGDRAHAEAVTRQLLTKFAKYRG